MSKKKEGSLTTGNGAREVDVFLEKIQSLPANRAPDRSGRLVFAMDATASRAPTWDMACGLQAQMFTQTGGVGSLYTQLVFFRGFKECKASRWMTSASDVVRLMSSVTCMAGQTQIERVLKHTLAEARKTDVDALVYVGDCVEEKVDTLGVLAGELNLHRIPMFIFQEGHEVTASDAFRQLAALSGGAHCSLDHNSASQLGELMNAAAIYATGGKSALAEYSKVAGPLTRNLLGQIR